jgi:hypothetical protein
MHRVSQPYRALACVSARHRDPRSAPKSNPIRSTISSALSMGYTPPGGSLFKADRISNELVKRPLFQLDRSESGRVPFEGRFTTARMSMRPQWPSHTSSSWRSNGAVAELQPMTATPRSDPHWHRLHVRRRRCRRRSGRRTRRRPSAGIVRHASVRVPKASGRAAHPRRCGTVRRRSG